MQGAYAHATGGSACAQPYVTIAAVALYDRIQSELIEARRNRDEVGLSTLSLLKSELVKASKEAGSVGTLDDDLVVRIARKEVKRREEAIEVYRKAGREESATREEAEMAVLRGYLPAAMTNDEVESEVRTVIAEIKPEGPNAFGVVMKAATARLAGRAEGAQVAAAARKLLGS
ncbi:MAG: GatB/YqeY domain-containing protein [Candidatus Dormibacteraeota bacterium]|nr:GatB/YqeY domain-containing protein [Candidatus Dormibacteraeota bacterium]